MTRKRKLVAWAGIPIEDMDRDDLIAALEQAANEHYDTLERHKLDRAFWSGLKPNAA